MRSAPRPRARLPIAILLCAAGSAGLSACGGGHARGERSTGATGAGRTGQTVAHAAQPPRRVPGPRGIQPRTAPRGRPVNVRIGGRPRGRPVPRNFLGLSFEASEIPTLARLSRRGDLTRLLRSLGPGVMRFGGASADKETAWTGAGEPLPSWARIGITARDLHGLARLARASGWSVILTVGLAHPSLARASAEAAAAHRILGGSLLGIAIGNEPDRYAREGFRSAAWSFDAYLAQFRAYRAALARAAPGVAIVGPDPATGVQSLGWVRSLARVDPPAVLGEHYYPLSGCGGSTPTLTELLSARTRREQEAIIASLGAISRRAGAPLRIDETNDVTCRGEHGVSDTLGSALWALQYIARTMAAGLAGVNFHDLLAEPDGYSPLVFEHPADRARGELQVDPKWYALLLARRLLGDRPVPVRAPAAGSLSVTALQGRGSLQVVLVNPTKPGTPAALLRLHLPGRFREGTILRLNGPSPGSRAGVRLAGRRVSDGSWAEPAVLPATYRTGRVLELSLPPSSAALVTLPTG